MPSSYLSPTCGLGTDWVVVTGQVRALSSSGKTAAKSHRTVHLLFFPVRLHITSFFDYIFSEFRVNDKTFFGTLTCL